MLSPLYFYVFYLAFLVFHVCKFNIIIKYNKIKWNKTFIVLIVKNSYLSRFPDGQAIILAVSLCKSDWSLFYLILLFIVLIFSATVIL